MGAGGGMRSVCSVAQDLRVVLEVDGGDGHPTL